MGVTLQGFETAPPEIQDMMSKPIRDLGLKLEGSPLERFVVQLYTELDRKKIGRFHPRCYLSDEWGCPSGEPVIGIPFYLANPKLQQLESEMNDLEDAREIMMYLRHEAGHAYNYAYELYKTPEWHELFGPFRRPYRDKYKPVPFSRKFVRHMAGWYAQKHPDEDFAETFAVWLTPRSNWRKKYQHWGALAKLKYMERTARRFRNTDPIRCGQTDITVEEMDTTVHEFYEQMANQEPIPEKLALDTDLIDIFLPAKRRRAGLRPAADLLKENRKPLIDKVAYWTGVQRPLIKNLIESILSRVRELDLRADVQLEPQYLTEISAYATVMAMNYLTRGKFIQR
jgi:hypothetical protein